MRQEKLKQKHCLESREGGNKSQVGAETSNRWGREQVTGGGGARAMKAQGKSSRQQTVCSVCVWRKKAGLAHWHVLLITGTLLITVTCN